MKTTLLCALLALLTWVGTASAGEIVIAHPDFSADALDEATLRDLYLGKTVKAPGGDKVHITILANSPASESFFKAILAKTPAQFLNSWRKLSFSGRGTMPISVDTDAEMIAHVLATPGAIGYVSDQSDVSGVKTLAIR